MTLYEINEQILHCFFEPEAEEVIDETTGEIFDAGYLDRLQMAKEDKAENVALYIKNLDAEAEAIKAEKVKLQKRQQQAERKAESLRNYLANNMAGEKMKTARVYIGWRKSERVTVADPEALPLQYIQTTTKPMLAEIKKALKAGEEINGCSLEQSETIQIK